MARHNVPLSDSMIELVAQRFRMLGEPQRLRILQTLEGGEKSVNEITSVLGATQSNVSKHLQALYGAGLVGRTRRSNSIVYEIADPIVFQLCELVCRSAAQEARLKLEGIVKSAGGRKRA